MARTSSACNCKAFTISELVVVLAIVGAVAVMALPVLGISREKARRQVCSRNLRTAALSIPLYANENRDSLYSNLPESGFWDTQCLPAKTYEQMTNWLDARSLDCPGLYPFTVPGMVETPGGRVRKGGGIYIGYNYLGGITNLPDAAGWVSPLKSYEDPASPVFTDPNNHGDDDRPWAIVPHQLTGPARLRGSTYLWLDWLVTPKDYSSQGGNVATLNGAVSWRPIQKMEGYHWIARRDLLSRGFW